MAGTLLDAQVDLNPHQVEAALFAFKSPLSKGAILADEVGLGKTIEAGLLLSQKWTEGKRRIIIIGPANLRKQWAQEMEEKFFLPSLILEAKNYNRMVKDGIERPFEQNEIVICSFQFAARHADALMMTRWDLAVIDEAHRLRNVYRPDNKIGKALKNALINAPKVLLTATPLQNSLMELYGLVSLVDDFAFGDAKSFRSQYARLSGSSQFDELKKRLAPICHRTLRRQVMEYIRYTNRIPITQEFIPTTEEQALYDMVSDYLRRDALQALPSGQRTLMTLIMRKLLASSTFAIAGALDSLARKLERQLREDAALRKNMEEDEAEEDEIAQDVDGFAEEAEEWIDDEETPELLTDQDIEAIEYEIEELRQFRDRAVAITENAKGLALLSALQAGFDKARELGSAEKAIIFTESRRTQEYLVRLLSNGGYAGKLVLFNGSNTDDQSKAIYEQWKSRHAGTDKITGSRSADMRAALVEYFRNDAAIMIATEAAAEGINLQFCSMVVNYDLPWNPQRIEQRIGRCHRYGQKHDVVVINFLNKNNAADQRIHQLLSEKFQLFSGVFGASDEVLGAIESGVEFEKRIVSIYQTCRSEDEIEAAFEALQAEMSTKIDETMEDTRKKLLENFDADVHDRLRMNMSKSKEYLGRYEQLLWSITKHELAGAAIFDDDYLSFKLAISPGDVDVPMGHYHLTKKSVDAEGYRYRLGHDLAQFVVAKCLKKPTAETLLTFDYTAWPQKSVALEPMVGESGTLSAQVLTITGADEQDHIILAGVTDDGTEIEQTVLRRLFDLPAERGGNGGRDIPETSRTQVSQALKASRQSILDDLEAQRGSWFDEEMDKLDNWADDKRAGLKADLKDLDDQIKDLKRQVRQAGALPDKLALQKKARKLEQKRDDAWREYDDAAKQVDVQKDALLDQVEERLQQQVSDQKLFTIRFAVK
ncbi:MAG: SNF2-related protein [Magnetovibrionaceae bacterium]